MVTESGADKTYQTWLKIRTWNLRTWAEHFTTVLSERSTWKVLLVWNTQGMIQNMYVVRKVFRKHLLHYNYLENSLVLEYGYSKYIWFKGISIMENENLISD